MVVSSETPFQSLTIVVEDAGLLGLDVLEQVLDDLFLVAAGRGVDPVGAVLHFIALVDEQRGVAAVIDDELRAEACRVDQRLPGAPPVFLERFALPGEHRNAGGGDGGGGVVLGREDVAGNPAHFRAELDERLDEHGGLDRHVQRAHDAHALQRLLRAVLGAGGHQAGHLMLGDFNFLAAEIGQGDVADFVVGEAHVWCGVDRLIGKMSDRSDESDSRLSD